MFKKLWQLAATKTSLQIKTELRSMVERLQLFHVGHVARNGRSFHYYKLERSILHIKAENERFTAAGSRCHHNFKFRKFHVVVWQTTSKIAPKIVFSSVEETSLVTTATATTTPENNDLIG